MGFRGTLLLVLLAGLHGCEQLPEPLAPDEMVFRSVQPTPRVRFATIGDYGIAGRPAADVANLVKSWNPDFVLTLGDNNYEDGEASTIDANIGQYYHSFIYPYTGSHGPGATTNRFWPTLGNHDYHAREATPYLEYFALPGNERYYDFRDGPVHFFALNSNRQEPDGNKQKSAQATWLKNALAASTAPWKVVYFHHAPYSSARHGNDATMQWPFQEWGASIVLAGHDHAYERLLVNGFPYIVNGLGGNDRYPFGKITPGSVVRFGDDFGAQLVEATDESMTLQFYTRTGDLIDTFTMTRTSFQNGAQPTVSYTGNVDTHIAEADTSRNYGSSSRLLMDGKDPSGLDKRALLQWDVSAIPANATVTGASITLNVVDVSPQVYEVYRVKRGWKEHRATWVDYSEGIKWIKPGANDPRDRGDTALGTITGSTPGAHTITLNRTGVAVVQGWVNGSTYNRGVLIMGPGSTNGLDVSSSEAANAVDRPKLTVTYYVAGNTW